MTESTQQPPKPPLKKNYEHRQRIPLYDTTTLPPFVGRNESQRPIPQMEELLKAYSAKDLKRVTYLLSTGLPINYREPVFAHRTPVLYAAKFDFVEALDVLLERGADITLADDNGITPLHAAASNGSLNPLKRLLEVNANPNVKNKQGQTPLHAATRALGGEDEANAFIIVQTLLNGGAILSIKDEDDRTPLHEAAYAGNAGVLSLFLSGRGASLIYERDKDGRTPLHLAVLGARSLIAVKLLLQYNPPIDAKDNIGQTPLHYVAGRSVNHADKDFDLDCLELLLTSGASAQIKDDIGKNALSLALQRTMWWNRQASRDSILHSVQLLVAKGSAIVDGFDMWRIVETFPSLVMVALNQSIRVNTSAKDSLHLKLILDFKPLTVSARQLAERQRQTIPAAPTEEQPIPPCLLHDSEISMLHYIYWAGHKNLLRHPLCSTFLHLKWLKVRKFFITHVVLYFLFVLAFTAYILNIQPSKFSEGMSNSSVGKNNSPSNFNQSNEMQFDNTFSIEMIYALRVIIFCFTIFFGAKEILQIGHSPSIYARHYENYVDILILLCVLLLLFLPEHKYLWQNYISTIAVIASWSRLMLFLGQFPSCGVYIVMFSTVCKTVLRFLAMYLPLLIAFALGFRILFQNQKPFNGLFNSTVTTLVMMTGEVEYEDRFLDPKLLSTFAPCVTLIFFLLLVYIILSNLLVALAVNDLNGIQQRSEILRLSRQVELMVTVDSFLRSPFVPYCIRRYLHKKFSIFQGHGTGMIALYPNKKYGYCEKLFINLLYIIRCRRLLTKIFEYFVSNFIPPEVEPLLPSCLIQEAIQLALTELEIEKRDKLLYSKSHQFGSLRQRAMLKKRKNIVNGQASSVLCTLPRRDSLQKIFKEPPYCCDDIEMDPLLTCSRQQTGHIKTTPSLKASLWRASVTKEAFRGLHASKIYNEQEAFNLEIEELRKTVSALQSSINILTEKFPSVKQAEQTMMTSHPIFKPKPPESPLIKSPPKSEASESEFNTNDNISLPSVSTRIQELEAISHTSV